MGLDEFVTIGMDTQHDVGRFVQKLVRTPRNENAINGFSGFHGLRLEEAKWSLELLVFAT